MAIASVYQPEGVTPAPSLSKAEKRTQDASYYNQYFAPHEQAWNLAEGEKKQAKRVRQARKGLAGGVDQVNRLRDQYGYNENQDALETYGRGQLDRAATGDTVNLRHTGDEELGTMKGYANQRLLGSPNQAIEDVPELARLSKYARERLGSGMTPEEANALRGQNIEAVEGAAASARQTAASAGARSGYGDPRLGMVTAGRIERERQQGRAGAERFVTEKGLERKGQIESLTSDVAKQEALRRAQVENLGMGVTEQEEGARKFDVGANVDRQAAIERLAAQLGDQDEARREYDLGFTQARKSSKWSKKFLERALRRAEPTGLEKTNQIIGGIAGGLGGG